MGANLRFGKTPARPEAVKLKFGAFLDRKAIRKKLPRHPAGPFGHELLIKSTDWAMLANDQCGDCVWAGAAHETKMIAAMAKKGVWFSDRAVVSDYSKVTGYVPGKEETDAGTDMQVAAKYRQDVGIVDGHGNRHRIIGYAAIEPGTLEDHLMALYIFGVVGVGWEVPSFAMDQFDGGVPFDVMAGRRVNIVGGHYTPIVSRRNNLVVVTWAKTHPMTPAFLGRFNDESVVYFTDEGMTNRRTPEGFDYDGCMAALQALKAA